METEIKDNLPVLSGKVRNKNVEVFRDSGCNEVIVKKELVDKADFIGKVGNMVTVDRTLMRAPIARVEVDTSFYTGTVEAMSMKNLLFDLLLGMFREPGSGMIQNGEKYLPQLSEHKRGNVEISSH